MSLTLRPKPGNAPQGLAGVIVQAVRFIMLKTRQLRSDTALAHLNMLRGAARLHASRSQACSLATAGASATAHCLHPDTV